MKQPKPAGTAAEKSRAGGLTKTVLCKEKLMRFISTKTHGIIDYLMGVFLIISPWLLGFSRGGAESFVPIVLGVVVIAYSLLTRYELGVIKAIPMSGHLTLDFLGGAFLAASPWLFGFSHLVSTPHLVLGLLEMGAALTTSTEPEWAATTHRGKPGL
jgi:hypothetical protein